MVSQGSLTDANNLELLMKNPSQLTIKQLLQIPPEDRNIQHCREIIKHVKVSDLLNLTVISDKEVKFLEQYLYTDDIYDLAKEFRLKSYPEREIIFKQGEVGDAFYIILHGTVKVYINIPSEVKHFTNTKEIMTLGKGEAFGELALLYDSVRSATIATTEQTDVIVLDKESFRKHIKDVKTSHLSYIIDFFKNFPGFQGLNQNEIAKLAGKAMLQRFPTNTVIVRQGDEPSEVYYVKSGRLKVIKRIDYKIDPSTKQILYDETNGPSQEDYASGNYKSVLLEIDELSNGDSFCDSAIIKRENMHHTVVTAIPCELIYLTAYDFRIMFDSPFLNQYESLCKPYPDDSELRKLFQDTKIWADYKKKMINNVIVEKINKRIGFTNILRSPVHKMDRIKSIGILQRDDSPPFLPPIKSNLLEPIMSRISTKGSQSTKSISKSKNIQAQATGDSSLLGHSNDKGVKGGLQGKSYYNHKFEFVKPIHRLKSPDKKKDDGKGFNAAERRVKAGVEANRFTRNG